MALKTKEEAIKRLRSCIEENFVQLILDKLKNINAELFGDMASEYKTLVIRLSDLSDSEIPLGKYSNNIAKARRLIQEFLVSSESSRRLGVMASDKFAEEFSDLDEGTRAQIMDIIEKIKEIGTKYQTETLGKYYSSPRGHINLRIIWRVEGKNIMFESVTRHDNYYENLATKLRFNKIKPEDGFFGQYKLI